MKKTEDGKRKTEVSTEKLPDGLLDAGLCSMEFRGDDLQNVCRVLEGAAGIMARRGDSGKDLKAWKLACALNFQRLKKVVEHLGAQARTILTAAETPAWHAVALELQAMSEKVLGEPIPADAVLALAVDEDDARQHVVGAYGEAKATELTAAVKDFISSHARSVNDTANACLDRHTALQKAAAVVEQTVQVVQLQRVCWQHVPRALHGGYLRDLAWMFAQVPENAKQMVDTAILQTVGE
jgi:hypothetical protein